MTRIDVIGCCHGSYGQLKLEGGDLLIITGDLTAKDLQWEYLAFRDWLMKQDYKKKIFICGNHDRCIEQGLFYFSPEWMGADYLNNSGTEYEGLKIWGSPQSLWFDRINPICATFTGSEKDLKKEYAKIPDDIDILITHTPPWGIRDKNKDGLNCGSRSLRDAVERIKPKYHFFSHIHEDQGYCMLKSEGYGDENNTHCYNVSIMDGDYRPVNRPVTITF